MLLQDAPADTLNFMIFGFAVILGGIAGLVLSLLARWRNAARDLEALRRAKREGM
jgi:hypothetical protein